MTLLKRKSFALLISLAVLFMLVPLQSKAEGVGTIWGYKVKMPGNQFGQVPPEAEIVTVDGITSSANPFNFGNLMAGNHTVVVSVPIGWSVGYTLCYNDTSCHGNAPTPGNSVTVNVPAGGYADLWWHYSQSGTIQGYKATTSLNDPMVSNLKVSVDSNSTQTTNPFIFNNITPGDHTLSVEVPNGWSVGYTACINKTDCHTSTPVSGNTATVTIPVGGYVDFWWHFSQSIGKIQGYKLDNLGNPFTNPGAVITTANQSFSTSINPYIANVSSGNNIVETTAPPGYDAYYSVCINCYNHPMSSFVKGLRVTVNVPTNGYADVHWKYVTPAQYTNFSFPATTTLHPLFAGTLSTEIYLGYPNIYAPDVMYEDGLYKMWYGGGGIDIRDRIHYAESVDGQTWSKKGAVIEAPSGSFNANDPSVVKVGGKYYMYMTISGPDLLDRIYVSTSSDGKIWGVPVKVLDRGSYTWNSRYAARPTVIYENNTFKMWFDTTSGTNYSDPVTDINIGYATSSDGLTWQVYAQPVFKGFAANDVKKVQGFYVMVLQDAWLGTSLATSADGINWTKRGTIIPPDPGDPSKILGHLTPMLFLDSLTGKPKTIYVGAGPSGGAMGYDKNALYSYPLKEGELESFLPTSPIPFSASPATTTTISIPSPAPIVQNNLAPAISPYFPTGSLVNSGGTIYFISGSTKIPFTNWKAFVGLGYSLRNVVNGDLSNYNLSTSYFISTSAMAHPWGSWLTYKGTVYYSSAAGLIGVPSWDIFLQNGGTEKLTVKMNAYDIYELQSDSPLPLLMINDTRVIK